MKKASNIIIVIGVMALFFFALIFFAKNNQKNKEKKIIENSATTYATVLYCGFKNDNGNFVSIEYFIDDKKYLNRTSAPSKQYQENEQIEIVYNKEAPEKFIAHFYNMKINDTIKVDSSEATITNIVATKSNTTSLIDYEYFIDNIKYTRTNEVLTSDTINYSIGQKIAVSYNVNNPKSSIVVQ